MAGLWSGQGWLASFEVSRPWDEELSVMPMIDVDHCVRFKLVIKTFHRSVTVQKIYIYQVSCPFMAPAERLVIAFMVLFKAWSL